MHVAIEARRFKVGVQLEPQHTSMADLREAWRRADDLGVDSIWTWDHFRPVHGDVTGTHFEGWTQLAAMAVETSSARIGVLVSCMSYRNPDLLADMARTVDHLSGGRVILGLGAGWYGDEYADYGYHFGAAGERLDAFEQGIVRVKQRLERLVPGPVGPMPLLLGGGGERRTLRLVAEHADAWNVVLSSPDEFLAKNKRLTAWCEQLGRDPRTVQRSVLINDPAAFGRARDFVDAGAEHVMLAVGRPFSFEPVRELLRVAAS
ncbi:MAG TPA: LLM class F420-dependent oxidoreductase [Micromonosporaceae bacterium]